MTTPAQYLTAVRGRLEKPEAWTKGDYARDANGEGVWPSDPTAVCWCLDGAFITTHRELAVENDWYNFYLPQALRPLVGNHVRWNDEPERTHADILNLLDELIAEAPNGR